MLCALEQTRNWLDRAVVELNLCPYAKAPLRAGRVRIVVLETSAEFELLKGLHDEAHRLDTTPPATLETTLIVLSQALAQFEQFNEFLALADELLEKFGWDGVYQIANFHPDYQFIDSDADDVGNLSNRSPYPIVQLLREDSVSKALQQNENSSVIYARNLDTLQKLNARQLRAIFGSRYSATDAI